MNCWECNRPAHGVCKFCGRAVCKDHVQEKLHIISVFGEEKKEKALVTQKVLFCGKCKPVGEPILLEGSS